MSRSRQTTRRGAGAVLVAALALALVGCTTGTGDEPSPPTTTSPPATSAAPSPPDQTATPGGGLLVVPAYFMVDTRAGLRLAREQRTVAGVDAVRAAVEMMIVGPTDPDYASAWDPRTTVLGVGWDDDTLVVDLSSDARTANIGSEGAALMIQQLVYTATDAARGVRAAADRGRGRR